MRSYLADSVEAVAVVASVKADWVETGARVITGLGKVFSSKRVFKPAIISVFNFGSSGSIASFKLGGIVLVART